MCGGPTLLSYGNRRAVSGGATTVMEIYGIVADIPRRLWFGITRARCREWASGGNGAATGAVGCQLRNSR